MTLFDEKIRRLFRINKTLNQMLKDRGYIVTDSEIEMTIEQFVDKYGENMKRKDLVSLKIKRNNDSDKIFVLFMQGEKVTINDIKPCVERMKSENVFRAILVLKQEMTRPAQKAITEAIKFKLQFEVFQETDLLMNVTEHAFVPEHIALTPEEKKALLERYTVKESQLPRIQFTDPIARYYGLQRGEVVKIIRKTETAERYVTYRYVI